MVILYAAIAPSPACAACLHAHSGKSCTMHIVHTPRAASSYLLRRSHLMERLGCRTGAPVRYDTGSHSAQYASKTAASRSASRVSFCRAANVVLRTSRSALTCADRILLISDARQASCIRPSYKRSSWTWLMQNSHAVVKARSPCSFAVAVADFVLCQDKRCTIPGLPTA